MGANNQSDNHTARRPIGSGQASAGNSSKGMITNIQALRAFASIAVMLYHMNYPFIPGVNTDFQGVAIFFVISGFIMTHITHQDNRETTPASFMLHRLVRIVPLYWFCVLLFLWLSNLGALNLAGTLPRIGKLAMEAPMSLLDWFGSTFHLFAWASPADVIRTLLFIPYKNSNGAIQPLLGVGWTLNIEMYFYALFALMLFFGSRRAPAYTSLAIVAIWLVGKGAGKAGGDWLELYSSDYVLCFAGGVVVYYLWRRCQQAAGNRQNRLPFIALVSILTAIYVFSNLHGHQWAPDQSPVSLITSVLLVFAALLAHSLGLRLKSRWVLLLGAASYSLYLVHTVVLEMIRTPAQALFPFLRYDTTLSGVAIAAVACLVVALVVHLTVELPSLRWLRRKVWPRPATP